MDFSLITALENEFVDERGYVKRKINCAKCLTLLNELRSSLPMCIEEAQRIVDNKQRILANADSVAKATVETAQKKAEKILSESGISEQADVEARKIVGRAVMQKDILIDKTKTHLDGVFDETEKFLNGLLGMIMQNRRELAALKIND